MNGTLDLGRIDAIVSSMSQVVKLELVVPFVADHRVQITVIPVRNDLFCC